ncbi:ryncolin-1-like [Rhagoletis pomonella]|uniref:ryncolin-1-like n=1 Tax=Rhagoletis pomonella TaxID=28610 RepID=UPI00177F83F0|nr:ryncolin-1-like [Rhagoletis pomonella]
MPNELLQAHYLVNQNNELEDTCDCNCDLEIDIIKHFSTQLESLQQLVKQSQAQILKLQAEKKSPSRPTNCMEAAAGSRKSGIYTIKSQLVGDESFMVWCDEETDFGGWIVIQRRLSAEVDFYRDWQQYKQGFGELSGNYWIGLDKLHALTASCEQELYIKMEASNGTKYYAKYVLFVIGSEEEDYVLRTVGAYKGNARHGLRYHEGSKFATFDRDNDADPGINCAERWRGAWWYKQCYHSNLNGDYSQQDNGQGVTWIGIKRNESLKFAQMMIRPTQKCIKRLAMKNFSF